jgi:eukaryotic-like serine/threonine-protein kinase
MPGTKVHQILGGFVSWKSRLDGVMGQPLPGIMAKVLDEDSTVARLSVGARLGPYRIEAPLGAGGMGEVYQALDTRLDRAVAIKIMHQQFSERFEREARAIAALNHPHICHLYDVGPNYLVMELVEGETLANRLKRGALPLLLALQYGSQTAGALAAAHAKGIVHRDLKPGNIMVTKSGVKVLDFGLAKSQRDETLTQTNAVIGTPKYMAPEQREGKECDARTDIYALGLVLREMAADFPPHVAHVVERCIADDPDERWQAASDVRNELEWTASSPAITVTALATRSRAPLLGWIAAGALLIGLGIILAFVHFRETPPAAQPVRLQIPVPDGMSLYNFPVAISPDGRRVAFRAGGTDSPRRLWIRELDSLELKPLPSTEVSILTPPGPPPFWSPDGRWVAFVAGGKLKKVEISGGLPQTICNGESFGGAWNRDGVIILGVDGAGLSRCPAMGGPAAPVTVLAPGETAHVWPQFLPDGRHFLYSRIAPEKTSVFVGSLDAKPAEQEMKPLLCMANLASLAT